MITPELPVPDDCDVDQREQTYYTVQHRLSEADTWEREVPPLASAEQAIAVLEAHASWYTPGRIRAVRKVVRTTVETYTAELRA